MKQMQVQYISLTTPKKTLSKKFYECKMQPNSIGKNYGKLLVSKFFSFIAGDTDTGDL
jgi:hypothetical protein